MNETADIKELQNEILVANKKISELEKQVNDLLVNNRLLKDKEELFQLLLKYTPIQVFFKDKDCRTVLLSSNFKKILNAPVDTLEGKKMQELLPQNVAKRIIADDKKVLNEGQNVEVTETLNGREYSIVKFPVKKANGTKLIAGFAIDITEKILIENKLKESEERLNTLINAAPDIICFKDGKGRWLKANDEIFKTLGLKNIDYYMKTDNELAEQVTETHSNIFRNFFRKDEIAWKAEAMLRNEEILCLEDGSSKVFDVIKKPIYYPDKSRKGMVIIARDITDRKTAEEKLRKSERLYRTLIESADDAVVLSDFKYNPIIINKAFYKLLEIDNAEKEDIKNLKHVHKEDKEYLIEQLNKIEEKGIVNTDFRLEQSSGSIVDVSGKSTVIWGEDGKPESVLTILRDVTNVKNKERELIKLDATKNKFFGIIAHDLRSPFLGILGLTEVLLSELYELSTADMSKMLTKIHNSSDTLFKLLNNLLDWAKLQQEVIEYKPESLLPEKIIINALELFEQNIEKKKIKTFINIQENISVWADNNMLNTVIRNLLANAIKFTPQNGAINLLCYGENGSAVFSIKDNGIGMSEEAASKLFKIEEKYQEKGTEGESGSGLGLIICKEMVERLGGKISFNSKIGKGSEFYFTCPLTKKG